MHHVETPLIAPTVAVDNSRRRQLPKTSHLTVRHAAPKSSVAPFPESKAMAGAAADGADPAARWHVGLRVRGRVQGVFFRASTQMRAIELGLAGWVRNAPDGSVQLRALGPLPAVQALADWLRAGGPPAAAVDEIVEELPLRQVTEGDDDAQCVGFEIRRGAG
jgi:acylphosphatase